MVVYCPAVHIKSILPYSTLKMFISIFQILYLKIIFIFSELLKSKDQAISTPLNINESAEVLNPLIQAAMSTTTRSVWN